MGVDSSLELITTLYGWVLYNNIWSVLTGTGLAFIPFIVILIRNFMAVTTSMEFNAGASASVRRMEVDIAMALTVVVLAAQPVINLQATDLTYTPMPTIDNPAPATVTAADTGTTYGHADGGFSAAPVGVRIPVWWYGVMALSSGINRAVIAGFPASNELRELERSLRTVNIENPALRRQVNDFYTRCYVPARSKFLAERPDAADPILAARGDDDVDWMGSRVYLTVPGYYDTLDAGAPVRGFPIDLTRETDQYWNDTSGLAPSDGGIPTCDQWWSDPTHGLRAQLVSDNSRIVRARSAIQGAVGNLNFLSSVTPEDRDDELARRVLERTPASFSPNMAWQRSPVSIPLVPNPMTAPVQLMQQIGYGAVATVGTIGFYNLVLEPGLTLIMLSLPFVQSLTLMGIYALLPIILVFGMYQPSLLLAGAIGIFTVKFWAVLWYIVLWVDNNLFKSMYPDGASYLKAISLEHGLKQILLTMVIAGMYVTLPVLFTLMMGWIGVRGASGLNQFAAGLTSSSQRAGESGARAMGSAARMRGGGKK